jgi:ABC-2 type transport system permease protein
MTTTTLLRSNVPGDPLPGSTIPGDGGRAVHLPAALALRGRRPSLPRLAGLEVRKTLSTRSGRLLVGAAALLPVAGISTLLAVGQEIPGAQEMLIVLGSLVAILMLAVGVLSSAGEWTHRTVQTTFLTAPRRGRVVAAKYAAAALSGAVITAFVAASTLTVAALAAGSDFVWTGAGMAVAATVAAGAALAAAGAGIGAAVANTPAALTGTFVTLLVGLPLLAAVRPQVADKLDPLTAMANLVNGQHTATATAVLAGWVVIATTAGAIVTRRKAVA